MNFVYGAMIAALLFSSGSMIGWLIEVFFRRFSTDNKERIWINPGFLCGPCLPLYGFALIMLFLISLTETHLGIENEILRKAALFGLMAAAITAVEFVAGEIFILRRHLKLWDYSDMRLNYKGIVCVRYTLYWTMLGAFYYYVIHPRIMHIIEWFSGHLMFSFVLGLFYGILFIDIAYSFELTAKIKAFAEENSMIIRYEEFKKHIRVTAKHQTERFAIMRTIAMTNSIKEQLKSYMEKQIEQAKNGRLNDFIDDKIISKLIRKDTSQKN